MCSIHPCRLSPTSSSPSCFFFQAEDGIRDESVTGVVCSSDLYLEAELYSVHWSDLFLVGNGIGFELMHDQNLWGQIALGGEIGQPVLGKGDVGRIDLTEIDTRGLSILDVEL